MNIDWVAVSGVASAAASVTAIASIALAYRGIKISQTTSNMDRRNYLDSIFVRWLDSVEELDRAALPFLDHPPTQAERDSPAPDLSSSYNEFHLAFARCRNAVNLLGATGIFDLSKAKGKPGHIADKDLVDVFSGVLWAYYFAVVSYPPSEAAANKGKSTGLQQAWESAVAEVEEHLKDEDVPEKYLATLRAQIAEVYPESGTLSVWQAADRLRDFCKSEIASRYATILNSLYPWR